MNVILYSTGCPKCKILEKKLDEKNIDHTYVDDIDLMLSMGMTATPMLDVDGELMDFNAAVKFVNNL